MAVLWRSSDVPVTNGHDQVHLMVKFVNFCGYLTKDNVHSSLFQLTQKKCNNYFNNLLMTPLEEMCPDATDSERGVSRQKRFILETILIVFVIVAVVSSLIMSTVTYLNTAANKNEIDSLKNVLMNSNNVLILPQ